MQGKGWVAGLAAVLIGLLACGGAQAKLKNYGVVVGRPAAHFLEPVQGEGRWPHYVIDVDTAQGRYHAVINVYARINEQVRYRAVPIQGTSGYGSIFSLPEGLTVLPFHTATNARTGGALDFQRHPGVLRDISGQAWEDDQLVANSTTVPLFDELLDGASRVYIFGEPFANSDGTKGIHDVHQNQGNPATDSFANLNGVWQDGAVIIEYPPVQRTVNGGLQWVTDRTLVQTRFIVQGDFTTSTGTGVPPKLVSSTSQQATGGGWVHYGPFKSDQLEVELDTVAGDPDVYIRAGSRPTTSAYNALSYNDTGYDEFARVFDAAQPNYYVSVQAYGSATAKWNVKIRYRQP